MIGAIFSIGKKKLHFDTIARHVGRIMIYGCYVPESTPSMTSKLRNGKYHEVFISRSRNWCEMRPIIGMIVNGFGIRDLKNCLIQLSIRIIGCSHKLDEIGSGI